MFKELDKAYNQGTLDGTFYTLEYLKLLGMFEHLTNSEQTQLFDFLMGKSYTYIKPKEKENEILNKTLRN